MSFSFVGRFSVSNVNNFSRNLISRCFKTAGFWLVCILFAYQIDTFTYQIHTFIKKIGPFVKKIMPSNIIALFYNHGF